jgi:hypothetical protein
MRMLSLRSLVMRGQGDECRLHVQDKETSPENDKDTLSVNPTVVSEM